MVIAASNVSGSTPLNALVSVFGIAGGIALFVIVITFALSADHKRRRNKGRYRKRLKELEEQLRIEGASTRRQLLLWDSARALTTGDLVMNPMTLNAAIAVAQQLRGEATTSGTPGGTSPGRPERA